MQMGKGNQLNVGTLLIFCISRPISHPHRIYSVEVGSSRRLNNSAMAFQAVFSQWTRFKLAFVFLLCAKNSNNENRGENTKKLYLFWFPNGKKILRKSEFIAHLATGRNRKLNIKALWGIKHIGLLKDYFFLDNAFHRVVLSSRSICVDVFISTNRLLFGAMKVWKCLSLRKIDTKYQLLVNTSAETNQYVSVEFVTIRFK